MSSDRGGGIDAGYNLAVRQSRRYDGWPTVSLPCLDLATAKPGFAQGSWAYRNRIHAPRCRSNEIVAESSQVDKLRSLRPETRSGVSTRATTRRRTHTFDEARRRARNATSTA